MKAIYSFITGRYSYAELTLIFSLSIAFCQQEGMLGFLIMLAWASIALIVFLCNTKLLKDYTPCILIQQFMKKVGFRSNSKNCANVSLTFLKYNMGSRIVIWLYTVFLIIFGLTESRFFSTNITTFINGVSALSIIFLFGKRGVKCSLISVCVAWVFCVINAILFPRYDSFWSNLEFHDLAFGAGYILLYYLFIYRKWKSRHIIYVLLITAIILGAFKRIELAALLLTAVIWCALRFLDQDRQKKVLYIGCICAVVVCYLFVMIIVQGWLFDWFEILGIDPMGRNYYYRVLAEKCSFSPFFLGLGRNASATMFAEEWSYFKVGNVHSDILRMYAECGFILFGLWLLVYWWVLPKEIERRYGYRALEFYVLCTVYTFVVYATDNTELYLVNQFFYMLMPMYVASQRRKGTSEKRARKH